MKIPCTAVLLITLALTATSAFGRELEELEPGAKVQSKSKPGTDYRVQEVTRHGVWVEVPKRGGITQTLEGREGPSGTRRLFIPRDQVSGVSPLAPLTPGDFSAKDDFARLRRTLAEDASAANRAGDAHAADMLGPLREREALLRKMREKTQSQRLRTLLDEHFASEAAMRGYVQRSAEAQLWGQGKEDAPAATEKAWDLTLEGMLDSNPDAKRDLKALEGVRGALEKKVVDDLVRRMERDRAGANAEAKRLLESFGGLARENPELDLPEDMSEFLRNLRGVRDSTQPEPGPGPVARSPSPASGGAVSGPAGPTPPPIGALPGVGPGPELNALPEVDLNPSTSPDPGLTLGPGPEVSTAAPSANMTGAEFEDALRANPYKIQAELLEVEAKLRERLSAPAALGPTLVLVEARLRDANRHVQRIAGEALESDPAAFAAELYRRGEAYERRLRNLPPELRKAYREALGNISPLLARARAAARATAKPLSQFEGVMALRDLRTRIARARKEGLTGFAKQLELEVAEVKRRMR